MKKEYETKLKLFRGYVTWFSGGCLFAKCWNKDTKP